MNIDEKNNELESSLSEAPEVSTNNPFATEQQSEDVAKETDVTSNEVVKIKEDYNNLHNQYVRLAADFDNYRKRQAQEKEAWIKYGMEEALTKMIEVLDNFDRATASCEKIEDAQKVKDCFVVLEKQVKDSLGKLGLVEIETNGVEFDPNFHEAIMQTPTSEHKENEIINVLQKGYMYQQKVLRPSRVNVATAE